VSRIDGDRLKAIAVPIPPARDSFSPVLVGELRPDGSGGTVIRCSMRFSRLLALVAGATFVGMATVAVIVDAKLWGFAFVAAITLVVCAMGPRRANPLVYDVARSIDGKVVDD